MVMVESGSLKWLLGLLNGLVLVCFSKMYMILLKRFCKILNILKYNSLKQLIGSLKRLAALIISLAF